MSTCATSKTRRRDADTAWREMLKLEGGYAVGTGGRTANRWRPTAGALPRLRRRVNAALAVYERDVMRELRYKPEATDAALRRLDQALAEINANQTAMALLGETGRGRPPLWVAPTGKPWEAGRWATPEDIVGTLRAVTCKALKLHEAKVRPGRKRRVAERRLLARLAYWFEVTSGLRATCTPWGAFDRFFRAVMRYAACRAGWPSPDKRSLPDWGRQALHGYRAAYPWATIEGLREHAANHAG